MLTAGGRRVFGDFDTLTLILSFQSFLFRDWLEELLLMPLVLSSSFGNISEAVLSRLPGKL